MTDGIEHGTNRGYNQHRQTLIPPCDPCLDAHNIYTQEARVANAIRQVKPERLNHDRADLAVFDVRQFTRLYFSGNAQVVKMIEEALGKRKVSELLELFDRINVRPPPIEN